MKKVLTIIMLMPALTCREKKVFLEPEFILSRWARASETLDYIEYRKVEAFPKSREVFMEIYKEYYIKDVVVSRIEELDESRINKDIDGNSFYKRNVSFECFEVKRKTGKNDRLIRGNVDLIKYIDGKKAGRGWLMSNRTLIRVR